LFLLLAAQVGLLTGWMDVLVFLSHTAFTLSVALCATGVQVRTSEERMAALRAELLLREDNYNKHFRNGGAGEKVLAVGAALSAQADVMDWMLKKKDSTAAARGKPASGRAAMAGSLGGGTGGVRP
jgi:hypothetical protein